MGGRGRRQGLGCGCPPSPPLYIGARGRMPPWRSHLKGGAAPGGNGPLRVSNQGAHAPSGGNGPLGFPTLGALGPWVGCTSPPGSGSHATSAHGALRDRWPHPVDPRDPSDGPGTIPVTPETLLVAETGLPIYKSLPPDHSGTPRDVRDLIRDSEQHSVTAYILSL